MTDQERDEIEQVIAERDGLRRDAEWRARWHTRLGRGRTEPEGKFYERLEADRLEAVLRRSRAVLSPGGAAEKDRLQREGFDGLYHPNPAMDCGCFLGDLRPCGERDTPCRGGHARGNGVYAPSLTHPTDAAQLMEERAVWMTRHFDAGHTITKRDGYDECSCGATFWRVGVPPTNTAPSHLILLAQDGADKCWGCRDCSAKVWASAEPSIYWHSRECPHYGKMDTAPSQENDR